MKCIITSLKENAYYDANPLSVVWLDLHHAA